MPEAAKQKCMRHCTSIENGGSPNKVTLVAIQKDLEAFKAQHNADFERLYSLGAQSAREILEKLNKAK